FLSCTENDGLLGSQGCQGTGERAAAKITVLGHTLGNFRMRHLQEQGAQDDEAEYGLAVELPGHAARPKEASSRVGQLGGLLAEILAMFAYGAHAGILSTKWTN